MKKNDILIACNLYCDMYYFLQVVRATKSTVTVREIYANKQKGIPVVGEFKDGKDEVTKRVKDGRINLGVWTTAELWDGSPLQNKHPMWGINYNLY